MLQKPSKPSELPLEMSSNPMIRVPRLVGSETESGAGKDTSLDRKSRRILLLSQKSLTSSSSSRLVRTNVDARAAALVFTLVLVVTSLICYFVHNIPEARLQKYW